MSVLIIITAYLFFDLQFKLNTMRSLYQSPILLAIILPLLIVFAQSGVLTVDSTSLFVGVDCNYTIALINQTSISSLTFSFPNWTNATTDPFYLSRTQLVYSSTSLSPVGVPGTLKFTPTTAWVGSNFSFTLTNMRNPSSTKPYLITLTVDNGTSSSVFTSNLTRNSITTSTLATTNYSLTAGATSSSAGLYITPLYALLQNGSFMSITYNSSVISLSPSGSASYTIVSNTTGRVVLGSFSSQSYNMLQVVGLTISNPQAVTTHTITCLFYLNESNTIYNIENYTRTITLTPAPYTTLSTTSTLSYGMRTSLTATSTTPYTPNNNGTILAYTLLTYNSSEVTFLNTTNCVPLTSTTCNLTTSSSTTLTDLLAGIGNFTTTSLTFTLYTYFNQTNAFVPLCQSNLVLNYTLQTISASSNTSMCTDFSVGGLNNISLTFNASGVAAGDTVYITGFRGIPSSATWTAVNMSSTTWYYCTLRSGNLTSINSTSSTVTIYLPYLNNNYTISSTNITSFNLYRSSTLYSSSTTTSPLCAVTTPLSIRTSSLTTTTLLTYATNKIGLDVSLQLYDYAAGDYLLLSFNSSGSGASFLLAGSYVGVSYSVTVNGISATVTSLNDTALKVILTKSMLPTSVSPLLKIVIYNITNPPTQQSIFLQLTTYESTTSGAKETLTSTTFTTTPTSLTSVTTDLQLLANNTLSLMVSNPSRVLTNKNISIGSSVLSITLPSELNCSLVGNNTSINWNTMMQTSTSTASGNTTQITINLGQCFVSYFTGSISYILAQKYDNVLSTTTSISTANECRDGCYQCNSTTCTQCFNATHTNFTLLYGGVCYSTCPTGTYKSDAGVCSLCHASCSTCSGGSHMNCTTCSTSFQFAPYSYCLSVCGSNKYLAGSCMSCHINCQACLSESVCYVCKTNATLIGSVCEFTSCTSPCLSCVGSQANCTSCISGYSFYQSTCHSVCPSGTYKANSGGQSICSPISQPVMYVPLTIVGAIVMVILFGLRAYASKKIGNLSRRSRSYRSEESETINYKMNCWRMGSIIYTYLQIIGAVLIAMKNTSYEVSVGSTTIVGIGLIFHLLANIAFAVGFCMIVRKKKVENDNGVEQEKSEQQNNLAIRYKIVMVISAIFSFRTYKILYANLFVEKNMSRELRMTEKLAYPNQQTFNQINNTQHISLPDSKVDNRKTDPKESNIIIADKLKKCESKIIRSQVKESPKSSISPNSKKPIVFNATNEEIVEQPVLKLTQTKTLQTLPEIGQIYLNKKFNHPFLTYLTLINLFTATAIIIIGSIIQIMGQSFAHMLWWGVDCLMVSIVSFGLTSWDLWSFANLRIQEQHSQMSSIKNQVNQTHENLKQAAQIQIQVDIKEQKKTSPKKLSSLVKPSFSNRSTQKAKEIDDNQQLPVLKVFEDFDQKDQTVLKEAKTKKFSTKNLRQGAKGLSKRQASITNTRKNIHGELCEDIYINFQSQKLEKERSTTTYMKSRDSVSPRSQKQQPNRSLSKQIEKEQKQKEQQKQLQFQLQELEQQPPNFANISDIEEVKVQGHNVTISSGLIQEQIQ